MQIQAYQDGSAVVSLDLPTFIGCTSTAGPRLVEGGNGNFEFRIPGGNDYGIFVFDYLDESLRTPRSARFCHYFWHKSKLILRSGLDRRRMRHDFEICGGTGLTYTVERSKFIYHSHPNGYMTIPAKHVGIIPLLRFLEGRIDLLTLDWFADNK